MPEVHGLCGAPCVLLGTLQASYQVNTVGTFASQVVPDLVLQASKVALEILGFI